MPLRKPFFSQLPLQSPLTFFMDSIYTKKKRLTPYPASTPRTLQQYLDILVTSPSNFTSKYSKIRHKPSFSSISNQPSPSASSEDYIFIPNLSHTGIVTSLVDLSSPIGVKVQSAVKGVYPQKEQKMLMDSKLLDLAKPVTTVTSHLPNTLNKKSYTSASPQKRNVVLTGTMTMEDPYLDHEGRVTKPTKVHELVYNKRMMMPHSRRKTRFAREILSTMKRDLEEVRSDEKRSESWMSPFFVHFIILTPIFTHFNTNLHTLASLRYAQAKLKIPV